MGVQCSLNKTRESTKNPFFLEKMTIHNLQICIIELDRQKVNVLKVHNCGSNLGLGK